MYAIKASHWQYVLVSLPISLCRLLQISAKRSRLVYVSPLTHSFFWQNYSEYHILSLNSSFHLPISWCLLSTPQIINVGPIIRIILVPPLSSVNLRRERSRVGGWGLEPPQSETYPPWAPKWNDTSYRGLWRAASLSPGQPPPPLAPPHFEKAGYAPTNETDQNIIEFEHGHKRQLLSRSTIFMVYLLYITCKQVNH